MCTLLKFINWHDIVNIENSWTTTEAFEISHYTGYPETTWRISSDFIITSQLPVVSKSLLAFCIKSSSRCKHNRCIKVSNNSAHCRCSINAGLCTTSSCLKNTEDWGYTLNDSSRVVWQVLSCIGITRSSLEVASITDQIHTWRSKLLDSRL